MKILSWEGEGIAPTALNVYSEHKREGEKAGSKKEDGIKTGQFSSGLKNKEMCWK